MTTTSPNKWTRAQVAQFEKFEEKLAGATFAKKCEYPDDYEPTVLTKEEAEKLYGKNP